MTVGGSSFGADGGGAIVLLVAFLVLAVFELGLDRRLAIGAGVIAGVLALALAVGGSSHVTDALEDGPVGLAEDLGRRVQLSVGAGDRRLGRCVPGLRRGRGPRRPGPTRASSAASRAPRAALGVSLIVNDSPNDVVIAGLVVLPGAQQCAGARRTSDRTSDAGPSGTDRANRPARVAVSTVIPPAARLTHTAPDLHPPVARVANLQPVRPRPPARDPRCRRGRVGSPRGLQAP